MPPLQPDMHPDSAMVLAEIEAVLGREEAERIFWIFAGLVSDEHLMTKPAVRIESCVHQFIDVVDGIVLEHWYHLDELALLSGHHHLLVAVIYPDGDTYRGTVP